MWEVDHKEGWMPRNWCFQTVVLEKTFESPLDCKEVKPVNPKEYQPWIFISRTDAEVEAPILWPPDAKSQLIGKDPEAEKVWGYKEKRTTEDEKVGWHHQINGQDLSKLWEIVKDREAWCAAVHEVTKSRTQLSDWTTTNVPGLSSLKFSLLFLRTGFSKPFLFLYPHKDLLVSLLTLYWMCKSS